MMHMKINGGYMTIDDNNKTTASSNVAKEIYDNCLVPDGNKKSSENECGNSYRPDIETND